MSTGDDRWPHADRSGAIGGSGADWGAAPEPTTRYAPRQTLGQGGMGRVVAAWDPVLLREVAVKEVLPGAADGHARLVREACITAQLEHPGIVPVYDAGERDDGTPWYAMQVVRGRTLAEAMALPDREARIALLPRVLAAVQAVAFAHDRGVVHRDLKPENVLLGSFGQVHVVDWGLAVPIADGVTVPDDALTREGAILGTPRYMSPEQAAGAPPDPRSDVWSLGTVLYELLAGEPAFVGDSAHEVLARVLRVELVPLGERADGLPPDLVSLVDRALAADPAHRYPHAGALADDLERWLAGRRVSAHVYNPMEEAARFARRYRTALAVAAVGALVVVVVAAVAAVRTVAERDRAQAAERDARTALVRADTALADAWLAQALTAARIGARPEAEVLASAVLELREDPDARGVLAAWSDHPRPSPPLVVPLPEGCEGALAPDGQAVACHYPDRVVLVDATDGSVRWTRHVEAMQVRFLDDGDLALVLRGRAVATLDRATGGHHAGAVSVHAEKGLLSGPNADRILLASYVLASFVQPGATVRGHTLSWCADRVLAAQWLDDRRVAMACADGRIHIGAPPGAPVSIVTPFGQAYDGASALDLAPDGDLWIGTRDGTVARVDATTGAVELQGAAGVGAVLQVRDADGRLVVVGETGAIAVWDAAMRRRVAYLPRRTTRSAVLLDDGRLVRLVYDAVEHWTLPTVPPPVAIPCAAGIAGLAVSDDHVATADGSGTLTVFERQSGTPVGTHSGDGVAKGVTFAPGGSAVLGTFSESRSVVLDRADGWSATPGADSTIGRRVLWLGDDLLGVLTYDRHGLRAWHRGRPDVLVSELLLPELSMHDGREAPGRAQAVLLGTTEDVYIVDADPPSVRRWAERPYQVNAIAMADDGHVLLGGEGYAEWRRPDQSVWWRRPLPDTYAVDVAVGPGDVGVAVGTFAGTVHLLTRDGDERAIIRGHTDRVSQVAFSPDGDVLFTAGWDGTVRRWDLTGLAATPSMVAKAARADWGVDVSGALQALATR